MQLDPCANPSSAAEVTCLGRVVRPSGQAASTNRVGIEVQISCFLTCVLAMEEDQCLWEGCRARGTSLEQRARRKRTDQAGELLQVGRLHVGRPTVLRRSKFTKHVDSKARAHWPW